VVASPSANGEADTRRNLIGQPVIGRRGRQADDTPENQLRSFGERTGCIHARISQLIKPARETRDRAAGFKARYRRGRDPYSTELRQPREPALSKQDNGFFGPTFGAGGAHDVIQILGWESTVAEVLYQPRAAGCELMISASLPRLVLRSTARGGLPLNLRAL
jgi:hypothetical protein